jgi:hypothetical protein
LAHFVITFGITVSVSSAEFQLDFIFVFGFNMPLSPGLTDWKIIRFFVVFSPAAAGAARRECERCKIW